MMLDSVRAAVRCLALLLVAPAAGASDTKIPFEKYELPNGLEVILSEDHATPVVHVEVWYHAGSKNEVAGRTGFAHLFEHMMFQGSKHFDEDYFNALSAYGAQINGTTNTERTNYYETVPTHVLERALWLEADRMGFLLDTMTQEKLDNQRDVVRNERRQSYETRPYGEAARAIQEQVWPEWHPYHHMTIGSHEDLEAASMDDVKKFFRTWYVPNNATLAVVGDFEKAQTKLWIERLFGPLPRGPEPRGATMVDCPPPEPSTRELTDDVQLAKIFLAWQSPAQFATGDADLDVLSQILSSGKSSRLYNRLVLTDRIAKDVDAGQWSRQFGSSYQIDATVAPGHTVEEVQKALLEEVIRLRKDGPTTAELERARNQWKKSFYEAMESVAGKSGLLQSYNHFVGDPDHVEQDLARYLAVTVESLQKTAVDVLDPAHLAVVVVRPELKKE